MHQSMKKRKLTIHIGTEKTGTTSIQSFLEINQIDLKKQGVNCPKSLRYSDSFNHRLAAVISYNDNRNDDNTKFLFKSLDDRKRQIENIKNALKLEISNNPCRNWIISSEHLQSRLRTKEEIFRLKKIFSKLFDEIKILIYIREPIETAASWWSTTIKGKGLINKLPDPNNPYIKHLCNHENTIKLWSSAFRRENIILGLYENELKSEQYLLNDFCRKLNIDSNNLLFPKKYENKKLSFLGMKYKRFINEYLKLNIKENNEYFELLKDIVFKKTTKDPIYFFTEDQIKAYENVFSSSNIWVQQEFFKERKYLWSKRISTKKNLQKELTLSPSEKKLFDIIFELVNELINLSDLDYSKKLMNYEIKYKNFSNKITINTFKSFLKFRFNKLIIKTLIILNKYFEKLLLT